MGWTWTFEDVQRANSPEIPPHWPKNTVPTKSRVRWLPADWGQASKITSSGKTVQAYISPCGKLCYGKAAVERIAGRKIEIGTKGYGGGRNPYTLDDVPPWPEWLPRDGWRVAFRRFETGRVHRVYITPDGTRWLPGMVAVQAHIAGKAGPSGEPLGEPFEEAPRAPDEMPIIAGLGTPLPKRRRQQGDIGDRPSPQGVQAKRAPLAGNSIMTALGARIVKPTSIDDDDDEHCVAVMDPYGPCDSWDELPQVVDVPDSASQGEEPQPPAAEASPPEHAEETQPSGEAPSQARPGGALSAEERAAEAEARAAMLEKRLRELEASLPPEKRKAFAVAADEVGDPVGTPEAVAAQMPSKTAPDAVEKPAPARLSIVEFFAFMQCQLKLEAEFLMQRSVTLEDPLAVEMWPIHKVLMERNQGKSEKWVPYHTVLGVHELFVVKHIHHAEVACWTPYRRFVSMLVFRSTCKCDLFTKVQLPYLQTEAFWENPRANFAHESPMHEDLRRYRKAGNTLQTKSFLMIPERLVADDDENFIINIMRRSERLVDLASTLWPIVTDEALDREAKFSNICSEIAKVNKFGDTWVKMLTVCIDIAYPHLQLLADRCEVGVGAAGPLRELLEAEDGSSFSNVVNIVAPKKPKIAGPETKNIANVVLSYTGRKVLVRRDNQQLIQVSALQAGSFDRAHAVATLLSEDANEGVDRATLERRKQELLADGVLEVPALGLDKLAKARKGERGKSRAAANDDANAKALGRLLELVNNSACPSCEYFWPVLANVEAHAREFFKDLPLVVAQMQTPPRQLRASTLQVQLCEFRQLFKHLQRTSRENEVAQE
eukprot:CAMPEP_0117528482 /NCGR_PEP_ID=MMETSP0784-20121206/37337_1 /TAXON_ID=39447 /ORGANISM="" /LENGTH=829 /DNA_ID=CAMNT_0005324769 /DNA_START=18 /DNA_END=2507 /DNA_ORIENTATION=-